MADFYDSKFTGAEIDSRLESVPNKSDKVQNATPGNIATLKEDGGIEDSGQKLSDFAKVTDLQNKADKSVAFTVTLTAAGWADNAQTVSNATFLSAGYAYTVAPASSSFANYSEAIVYADDVTTDGQMVFRCDSAPTADLTVNIVRMVTAE